MLLGAAQYLAKTRNFERARSADLFNPPKKGGGGGNVIGRGS